MPSLAIPFEMYRFSIECFQSRNRRYCKSLRDLYVHSQDLHFTSYVIRFEGLDDTRKVINKNRGWPGIDSARTFG